MAQSYRVLLQQNIETTVANVGSKFIDKRVVDAGETYRDDPVVIAGTQGRNDAIAAAVTTGVATATATLDSGLGVYVGHAKAIHFGAAESATPAVYASDLITHTAPRYLAKRIDYVMMFGGLTFELTAGTTNGSRNVTFVSTASIVAGMTITASGIPTGTIVLSITDATTIVVSQAATATASVTAKLSSGDLLFEAPVEQIRSISIGAHTKII